MWNLIISIVLGIIIGIVGYFTVRTHYHWIVDIVIGVVGSFVTALLVTGASVYFQMAFSLPALLASLLGGVVLELLFKTVFACRSCLPAPSR